MYLGVIPFLFARLVLLIAPADRLSHGDRAEDDTASCGDVARITQRQ